MMRRFLRRSLLAGAIFYLTASLPLVLLYAQSAYFRATTSAEITRKLSHFVPMEAVFCGDSITAAVPDWSDALGLRPYSTLNLAAPGLLVAQVEDQVRRALALRTRRIMVMAGTNDLGDPRLTDDDILGKWAAILELPRGSSVAQRFVIGIPLQGDPGLDTRVGRLNHELSRAAERNGWRFVDLNQAFLASPSPRSALFPDGRHFSATAYRLWYATLQPVFATAD
jgi:lysophospholipase L1-like esterase